MTDEFGWETMAFEAEFVHGLSIIATTCPTSRLNLTLPGQQEGQLSKPVKASAFALWDEMATLLVGIDRYPDDDG